jgi:hypothetical protein
VLLASASYRPGANVAEYAAEFVPAFESLQGDFVGFILVLHSIPFLLGGTSNLQQLGFLGRNRAVTNSDIALY